jgi:hypothetical protein
MKRRHFKQIESPDRSRVSLVGAWEADYWTHELDVSHGELINIISKVGNSLPAVHRNLVWRRPLRRSTRASKLATSTEGAAFE